MENINEDKTNADGYNQLIHIIKQVK